MGSLNRVMLIGNLGRDPEIRNMPNGNPVVNFSLATSERWKNKEGNLEEKTEWHRIVVFGKTAEICKEYLAKGKQVYVEGRLQTREWEKDGQKRYTTEIIAFKVLFLGRKGEAPPAAAEAGGGGGGGAEEVTYEPVGNEEDIPF